MSQIAMVIRAVLQSQLVLVVTRMVLALIPSLTNGAWMMAVSTGMNHRRVTITPAMKSGHVVIQIVIHVLIRHGRSVITLG
tara:strand:- start:1258 stop:1500 length:243 start_codon:yes stop_codon:yes gene_type:complete